jgi:hypothetical protein
MENITVTLELQEDVLREKKIVDKTGARLEKSPALG